MGESLIVKVLTKNIDSNYQQWKETIRNVFEWIIKLGCEENFAPRTPEIKNFRLRPAFEKAIALSLPDKSKQTKQAAGPWI